MHSRNRKITAAMDEYLRKEARNVEGTVTLDMVRNFYDQLLYLTSSSRDSTNTDLGSGRISWNVQTINYGEPISDCVELNIGPSSIPLTFDPSAIHDQFVNDKVYIEIVQLPVTIGFRTPSGNRFHFECTVEYVGVERAVLTPVSGPIYLRQPLQFLDGVTLRFYSGVVSTSTGLRSVVLYDETINVSVIPGTNPAQFTTTQPRTVGLAGTVFPAPSVEVYLSQFNTNDPAFNSSTVTSNRSLRISAISPTNVLTVPGLDASAVVAGDLTGVAYLPKNNISVCLRCTCVAAETGNYIISTRT